MRRNDRRVTDPAQIEAILKSASVCRLGFVDDGLAYIVPMSFGVAKENGKLCLYFHSAPEGRKITLMEQAGKATFEADTEIQLIEADKACEFSSHYQSVTGHGTVTVLRNDADKLRALRCLMEHYTGKPDWEFPPGSLPGVVGIRLEVEDITGKANLPSTKEKDV